MSTSEELRQLRTIHLSLCVGCVLILGVFGFLAMQGHAASDPDLASVYTAIGPFSLGSIAVSFLLFRKKVASIGMASTPAVDLRAALILHWALIELPYLFNVLAFHLTGSVIMLLYAGVALTVLALRHPTPSRVQRWSTGLP